MYFDIALLYNATIKVAQPNKRQGKPNKKPNRIIKAAPHHLPFHTGINLWTAEAIAVGSNQP